MPDDSPWPGVTHRDEDLRLAEPEDDGGEPTGAMSAVDDAPTSAIPPARPATPRAAPPRTGAVPVAHPVSGFDPTASRPAFDADEVPFWLLPPPGRPGTPPDDAAATAPQGAVPRPGVLDGPPLVLPAPSADHNATRVVPAGRAPGPGLAARARTVAGPVADRARALPPVWRVAVAAVGVGLVVALVGSGFARSGRDATPVSRPSAAPSAVPLDADRIAAAASSTQDPAGSTTYDAANTLDGKPATAWNSDGKADGPGPGITLTYTFDAPVDLASVSLTNGYQKTIKSGGRNVDLYAANSRLRRVTVVTDGGRWTWNLADRKAPQALRQRFGTTTSVTLEIVSVYKGSRYTDVGVSEVGFTGVVRTS